MKDRPELGFTVLDEGSVGCVPGTRGSAAPLAAGREGTRRGGWPARGRDSPWDSDRLYRAVPCAWPGSPRRGTKADTALALRTCAGARRVAAVPWHSVIVLSWGQAVFFDPSHEAEAGAGTGLVPAVRSSKGLGGSSSVASGGAERGPVRGGGNNKIVRSGLFLFAGVAEG